MAYVIKEWFASETPNRDGVHVYITGRKGGLVSFLFSLVGIDPTVTMILDQRVVRFQEGSWSGFFQSVTPLENICSCGYGYAKPWKAAALIAILGAFAVFLAPFLAPLFWIGAIVYYFLNKQMKLALWDIGGNPPYAIEFKRSIIENKNIDETEAGRVTAIIEKLCAGPKLGRQPLATPQLPLQGAQHAPTTRTPAEVNRAAAPASPSSIAATAQSSGMRGGGPPAQPAVSAPVAPSAKMATCPACRAPVTAADGFCGSCGTNLK